MNTPAGDWMLKDLLGVSDLYTSLQTGLSAQNDMVLPLSEIGAPAAAHASADAATAVPIADSVPASAPPRKKQRKSSSRAGAVRAQASGRGRGRGRGRERGRGRSATRTGGAAPNTRESRGQRRSRRFVWSKKLHHEFVIAVFECGIKAASPKAVLAFMQQNITNEPAKSACTEVLSLMAALSTEHIKSHLQKFRQNGARSRAEFRAFLLDPDGAAPSAAPPANAAATSSAPAADAAATSSSKTLSLAPAATPTARAGIVAAAAGDAQERPTQGMHAQHAAASGAPKRGGGVSSGVSVPAVPTLSPAGARRGWVAGVKGDGCLVGSDGFQAPAPRFQTPAGSVPADSIGPSRVNDPSRLPQSPAPAAWPQGPEGAAVACTMAGAHAAMVATLPGASPGDMLGGAHHYAATPLLAAAAQATAAAALGRDPGTAAAAIGQCQDQVFAMVDRLQEEYRVKLAKLLATQRALCAHMQSCCKVARAATADGGDGQGQGRGRGLKRGHSVVAGAGGAHVRGEGDPGSSVAAARQHHAAAASALALSRGCDPSLTHALSAGAAGAAGDGEGMDMAQMMRAHMHLRVKMREQKIEAAHAAHAPLAGGAGAMGDLQAVGAGGSGATGRGGSRANGTGAGHAQAGHSSTRVQHLCTSQSPNPSASADAPMEVAAPIASMRTDATHRVLPSDSLALGAEPADVGAGMDIGFQGNNDNDNDNDIGDFDNFDDTELFDFLTG
eukprot:g1692.t1